ncbi:MAG: PDZ domain-containing protein [Aureliella sp.]
MQRFFNLLSQTTTFTGLCFVAVCQCIVAQDLLDAEAAAFQSAVERVSPCVVQIEAFQTGSTTGGPIVSAGPTTGTIVSPDGLIVTSLYGLEENPTSILAMLPGNRRVPARIVARDFNRELVLLKVEASRLPVPNWAEASSIQVGQWAIAVGKTLDATTASRSIGIVSALGRAYDKALQTDAKVSPINYGGPLIDIEGRVLGVLSPLSPGSFLESDQTDLYDSGIGFAIPSGDILARLDTLSAGRDIHRGLIGVVVKDQNELSGPVVITGATPGSPAAKAGLKVGDTVIEADGRPVEIFAHLQHAVGNKDAGDLFPLSVTRAGKRVEITCTLAKEIPVYRRRQLGIHLAAEQSSDSERATEQGLTGAQGRQVRHVEAGSNADSAGIKAGDRIVSIGGQVISDLPRVRQLLSVAELDQDISVKLVRGGEEREIKLRAQEWIDALPEELPPPRYDLSDVECTVKELKLGNFANKVTAILPPDSSSSSPGILTVMAQPGDIDADTSLGHWNNFCVQYGWIVVLVQSQNARAWTPEEIELPSRVVATLSKNTSIDPSRIVVSGIGVGGRLALGAAVDSNQTTGVLMLGTSVRRLGVRAPSRPGRAIDFLFVGDPATLKPPVLALNKFGYNAQAIAALGPTKNEWSVFPKLPVQIWLEELSKL